MTSLSPSPSSSPVSLQVTLLLLRVLTTLFLVITILILTTNTLTIEFLRNSTKFHFRDVYAYRVPESGLRGCLDRFLQHPYMLAVAVIGLIYTIIQLFFAISEFATGIKTPLNYELDFYGDKVISYLLATGSAAGFGVSKDLKDTFKALIPLDSTVPVDKFFGRGYASASLLLLAFLTLAVSSVFSSFAISKPIQRQQEQVSS